MAQHQRLWADINSTFEQDLPTTEALLDLLQRERKALETRHYDDYQQIISSKESLLAQLEQHASIRQQLLQQAGFNDESTTLSTADSQAPAVATAWRKLGKQWQCCQELNEINERIAQRTKLVVGQVLDLMRGQTGQTRLYTDKGNTSAAIGGRTITSA